ncbi:MAG TPA: hypothetical protein K8U77_08595 [Slackia equolifaciens]|uniref:Ryanodine receptor Ryr domain-containing protein n=1 Tax=Slackia equolifaciens TaxID=498718 RepID=A0A9D3A1V7_9ACTN|nr:hypothetical protein [Slackia equolifaciens]
MEQTKTMRPALPLRQRGVALSVAAESGRFVADTVKPMVSSPRKRIFRGQFVDAAGHRRDAVAVVFAPDEVAAYGAEAASLSRAAFLGSGPEVFEFAARALLDGAECPAILEEDAGANLEAALFEGAVVPGTGEHPEWGRPLCALGTAERARENAKIAFDIRVQVLNLHEAGLFHRDIRVANACVRRFGPAPEDIHATLIDHELATAHRGTDVPAAVARYELALFGKAAGGGAKVLVEPSSLVRDLGYLAAFEYELTRGERLRAGDALDATRAFEDTAGTAAALPYFSYAGSGKPVVRMLNWAEDVEPLGAWLALAHVDDVRFSDLRLSERIHMEIRHGGFLDARDRERIDGWQESTVNASAEQVARETVYERWRELCREQGRTPEYEDFDAQPALLQESNAAQVRDIPRKVRVLGYRLANVADVPASKRIVEFTPEETEYLARLEHERWMEERRAHGWTWGERRDDERRLHPDMVPYNELPEAEKDYDRDAVRGILGILESMGLAVCR